MNHVLSRTCCSKPVKAFPIHGASVLQRGDTICGAAGTSNREGEQMLIAKQHMSLLYTCTSVCTDDVNMDINACRLHTMRTNAMSCDFVKHCVWCSACIALRTCVCVPGHEVEAMGTTTQLSLPMAFHMSAAVLAACTSACLSSLANPTVGRQRS